MDLDQTTTDVCDDLAPGEQMLAQVMVLPGQGDVDRGDLSLAAAAFPHDRLLLALTDGRIMGWRLGRLGSRPVACVVSLPISLVVDVRLERQADRHVLVIDFTDESRIDFVVAPRTTDVKRFVAALRSGLPAPALAG